jgi:hypothetical protein
VLAAARVLATDIEEAMAAMAAMAARTEVKEVMGAESWFSLSISNVREQLFPRLLHKPSEQSQL